MADDITTPYHREKDQLQVNRFLEPAKEYIRDDRNAEDGSDKDIITHVKNINTGRESEDIEIKEYNNVKHLYGSECEMSILNAQKRKAINASQEFLLDLENKEKSAAFIDAQYELRQGRGQYIAKHIRSDAFYSPFGFRKREIGEFDHGNCYLVEFTCTENKRATIPMPIMAKVDTLGYNIFNLAHYQQESDKEIQLKHAMEIINESHDRISKQYGYSNSSNEVELLNDIVKNVTDKAKRTTQTRKSTPRSLGANADHWDDLARHSKKAIPDKELTFSHKGIIKNITYRFGINIIVPTKVKVEHSMKTVHRFALDFSKILLPIHIDFIVKHDNKEYVWTIHEFEPNRHQIFHTGYVSNDSRLFDMTESIEKMTAKHQDEEYGHNFFEKSSISTANMDRNDEQSMLNLHVYLAQSKFNTIYGNVYSGRHQKDEGVISSHYTDVGYIYKYNQYTIIASGIRLSKPQNDAADHLDRYSNFYTIIYWNNAPHSQNSTAVADQQVIANAKINSEISRVFDYMKNVSLEINKLVTHKENPPEAALDRDNFFIPAMIEHTVAHSMDQLRRNSQTVTSLGNQRGIIGVYYLSMCTREDRDLISRTKTQIMIKLLVEHFGFTQSSVKKEIFNEVSSRLVNEFEYDADKLKKYKHVPGYFGQFLKETHKKEHEIYVLHQSSQGTISTNETPKSGLDKWSDFWHEYLELRPNLNPKWISEDSHTMKVMNAHLIDSSLKFFAKKNEDDSRNTTVRHRPNHNQTRPDRGVIGGNHTTHTNETAPGNGGANMNQQQQNEIIPDSSNTAVPQQQETAPIVYARDGRKLHMESHDINGSKVWTPVILPNYYYENQDPRNPEGVQYFDKWHKVTPQFKTLHGREASMQQTNPHSVIPTYYYRNSEWRLRPISKVQKYWHGNPRWNGNHGQWTGQTYAKYPKQITAPHALTLAAAVNSPEFIPQSKLQAEIDALKRTVNELTLRSTVQ